MPAPTTITVLNSQTRWAGAPKGPWSLGAANKNRREQTLGLLRPSSSRSAAQLRSAFFLGRWLELHRARRSFLRRKRAAEGDHPRRPPGLRLYQGLRILRVHPLAARRAPCVDHTFHLGCAARLRGGTAARHGWPADLLTGTELGGGRS